MNSPERIAEASLSIGSIKLSPEKPFKWSSGYFMPIYNDNRMLLGSFEHRNLVTSGFESQIRREGLDPEFIAGTNTAGIAPAASLAHFLGIPLVVLDESKPVGFRVPQYDIGGTYDAVAATCPWAIPLGTYIANKKRLPFMYVRAKPKAHGLEQQIEGIPKEGQRVLLIDLHKGNSSIESATRALEEKGVSVERTLEEDMREVYHTRPANWIRGDSGILIEDLLSKGDSALKEVGELRAAGAVVTHCKAIFSYELPGMRESFRDELCNVDALLTYPVLLQKALETGYIDNQQEALLHNWREDPFNWGANHGFPPVKK